MNTPVETIRQMFKDLYKMGNPGPTIEIIAASFNISNTIKWKKFLSGDLT